MADNGMTAGQVAYDGYCGVTDWRSLATGDRLPPWGALPWPIRLAWMAAAGAVIEYACGQADGLQ